jgi:hypothetical protein
MLVNLSKHKLFYDQNIRPFELPAHQLCRPRRREGRMDAPGR